MFLIAPAATHDCDLLCFSEMAEGCSISVAGTALQIIDSDEGPRCSFGLTVHFSIADFLCALNCITNNRKATSVSCLPQDAVAEQSVTWGTDLTELRYDMRIERVNSWSNGWQLLDEDALRRVRITRLNTPQIRKKSPTAETSVYVAQDAEEAFQAAKAKLDCLSESLQVEETEESVNACEVGAPFVTSSSSSSIPLGSAECEARGQPAQTEKIDVSLSARPGSGKNCKQLAMQASNVEAGSNVSRITSTAPKKDCPHQ